jgi:hypothetical protein
MNQFIYNEERKALAEEMGYICEYHIENNYIYLSNFIKDNRHIWQCIDRLMCGVVWQTADLIDGHYINHKKYNCLLAAMMR